MSVSTLASLRPLSGQCLRRSRIGLLSVTLKSRSASLNIRAIVELPPQQRRLYSDQKNDDAQPQQGRTPPKQEKMTIRQVIGRFFFLVFRRDKDKSWKDTQRQVAQFWVKHPIAYTTLIVMTIVTAVLVVAQAYQFYILFYNDEISRFPEPVAASLRKAIYFTTITPVPDRAIKYYKLGLQQAYLSGMDPMSDEILGIKIIITFWLEKQNNFTQTIQILEVVRDNCLGWVANIDKLAKEGKITEDGQIIPEVVKTLDLKAINPLSEDGLNDVANWQERTKDKETIWGRRERLLKKAVEISVKLGEVYASPHVLDRDASHKHLIWAVESSLEEFHRRRTEKRRPGELKWLSPTEVGASMESLGRDYERRGEFHFAIPLFFQALRNCDDSCHRAVIMNNLAACFAQDPIYSPAGGGDSATLSLKELFNSSMPNSRKECKEAAANWAKNAYLHAKDVKGDERTPECDEACAVALCNWGDIVAMQGNTELARKKYNQGIELSNKLEFKAGVKQAQAGLRRLNAPKKAKASTA